MITTTDGTPEYMPTFIWGSTSDTKAWALAKVEDTFENAKALPVDINVDKGFRTVKLKENTQLTIWYFFFNYFSIN